MMGDDERKMMERMLGTLPSRWSVACGLPRPRRLSPRWLLFRKAVLATKKAIRHTLSCSIEDFGSYPYARAERDEQGDVVVSVGTFGCPVHGNASADRRCPIEENWRREPRQ